MKDLRQISQQIEDLLVIRNLRGMKTLQSVLRPGYYFRAAEALYDCQDKILIGTGFPVADTFETDGPVGAMILYDVLSKLGKTPYLVCGEPLYAKIQQDYRTIPLPLNDIQGAVQYTQTVLAQYQPDLIIAIERPGLNAQRAYANMRGEDISSRCGTFDFFMDKATCPTIAIGDGGNEIGMGNVSEKLEELNIIPSVTQCDELLIADVSNWAVYGLIAILSLWQKDNLFADLVIKEKFEYLSQHGSVDGVTLENTLTEDSFCYTEGLKLIEKLQGIILDPANK